MAVGEAVPVAAARVEARTPAAPAAASPGPAFGLEMSPFVWAVTSLAFLALFWVPLTNTANSWLTDAEMGHGLLLAPVAAFLAWKAGVRPNAHPRPLLGAGLLLLCVVARYVGGYATGFFFMRLSLFGALLSLILFAWGFRQILHWWLPLALLGLSVPLPEVVLTTLALPLQFLASQLGASLLAWREVPVQLAGNVINLPGHQLFVTEACSGLRSLASLIALGLLIGGLWLQNPLLRALMVCAAIPIAILLNGVRVFITGFLVYFVDPALGEGLMHYTEGWVIFVFALVILGGIAWTFGRLEEVIRAYRAGGVR